jgi:hypothetical protein
VCGDNILLMTIRHNHGRDGAFLAQSFMTGEQKVLLSFEISQFDREIRNKKSDANIANGANWKSCMKFSVKRSL